MEATGIIIFALLMDFIGMIFTFKGLVLIGIFYAIRLLRHIRKLLSFQNYTLVNAELEKQEKTKKDSEYRLSTSLAGETETGDNWCYKGSSIHPAKQGKSDLLYDDYLRKKKLKESMRMRSK